MGNILNIAKKEFNELIGNKIVLIILTVFLFLIIKSTYDYYDALAHGQLLIEDLASGILLSIWYILSSYGSLVCIVIGFSLVSSEKIGSALNTLLTKPLYRDTIINGKLLGALGFIACTFIMAIVLFISALFITIGSPAVSVLPDILSRLFVVFILSLIYAMIFFALSMLIALLVKDQAFALILSVIMLRISDLITNADFVGNIYYLLSGSLIIKDSAAIRFISELSPSGISLVLTSGNFFNPKLSLWSAFSLAEFEILRLVLYMVITITLCYIVFIRRDVV